MAARTPRNPIYPRLSDGVFNRFKAYVAATGNTDSAVVEAALQEYMDPARDAHLIRTRLDRAGRALARVETNNGMVLEALLLFIREWLTYLPERDATRADVGRRVGEKRFRMFQAELARVFAAGTTAAPRENLVPVDDAATTAAGAEPPTVEAASQEEATAAELAKQ